MYPKYCDFRIDSVVTNYPSQIQKDSIQINHKRINSHANILMK